jgi:FAD:protein FMN transferase
MTLSLLYLPFERARPLLGTRVTLRVEGLSEFDAHRVIGAGFAVVADMHNLMSFHESASDVSALNRDAAHEPVRVSPYTYEVIKYGQELAAASEGIFDMTVAGQLVGWGFLPRPAGAAEPDPNASWRDIELLGDFFIRFHRPLWIDLGGIAKGYAVDCAVEKLSALGAAQCSVNAGGDLRVLGPVSEQVLLRTAAPGDTFPVLDIENGSIASSSGREHLKIHEGREVGPHLHGLQKNTVGTNSFVSVVAEHCMVADALTKVVLAGGEAFGALLRARGATAYLHDAEGRWSVIGGGCE